MATRKSKWRWGRNGGYYAYANGVTEWVYGMSASEKRARERMYGRVLFYTQDDAAFERYERIHFPWHFKQDTATEGK